MLTDDHHAVDCDTRFPAPDRLGNGRKPWDAVPVGDLDSDVRAGVRAGVVPELLKVHRGHLDAGFDVDAAPLVALDQRGDGNIRV